VAVPLYWVAFLVTFLVTAAGPVAAAVWLRRRLGVPLRVFEVAAGFYVLNLLAQVPVFALLAAAGLRGGLVVTALVAPLVYALSEESLRYLSFRAGESMRRNRTSDGALMAGLGHGGMEAILFTLSLAWTVGLATLAPDLLRAAGVDPGQALSSMGGFAPVFTLSRLARLVCHLGFATLVVMAYRRSVLFLPAAMAAHLAVDGSTSLLQALGATHLALDAPTSWLHAIGATAAWLIVAVAWAALSVLLVALVRRAGVLGGEPARVTARLL
jgi:uncharacterized membrane protein YhfC